jgi:hypothetical protein
LTTGVGYGDPTCIVTKPLALELDFHCVE